MAGYLLPLPRLLFVRVINFDLGQQAGKVAGAVVIPLGEVTVFCARRLYAQVVHDDLLAGVNTDLVLPAGADRCLPNGDFLLLRRGGVRFIAARHTLDAEDFLAEPCPALFADLHCEVTALVYERHGYPQTDAVFKTQDTVKYQLVQLRPYRQVIGSPHDDAFFNAPGFPKVTVADDFVLHAVVLGIDASCQHEHTLRQLGRVFLPARHQTVLVLQVAAILPQLTETSVVDDLHLASAADCIQIFQNDGLPARPLADKSVQPKGPRALLIGIGIVGFPSGGGFLHLRLGGHAATARASVVDIADLVGLLACDDVLVMLKADVRPLDLVILAAMRAAGFPPLHRAGRVGGFNGAGVFDGGSGHLTAFRVVECRLPRHRQIPRVALVTSRQRPAVALVTQHIADRL